MGQRSYDTIILSSTDMCMEVAGGLQGMGTCVRWLILIVGKVRWEQRGAYKGLCVRALPHACLPAASRRCHKQQRLAGAGLGGELG
jgi:hypothetical protein